MYFLPVHLVTAAVMIALILPASARIVDDSPLLDPDWMDTGTLGFQVGGYWTPPTSCPPATFVTGYGLHYHPVTQDLTGITIQCSSLNARSVHFQPVSQRLHIPSSANAVNTLEFHADKYIVGFSNPRWTEFDLKSGRNRSFTGGREFIFQGEPGSMVANKESHHFPRNATSTRLDRVLCPTNWAVCGAMGRVLDSTVTQLRLQCCYICIPQERQELLREYTSPGSTDYTLTIRKTIGVTIESGQNYGGSRSNQIEYSSVDSKTRTNSISSGDSTTETDNESISGSAGGSSSWEMVARRAITTTSQSGSTTGTVNSQGSSTNRGSSRSSSNTHGRGTSSSTSVGTSLSTTVGVESKTDVKGGIPGIGEASTALTLSGSVTAGSRKDSTQGQTENFETNQVTGDTKSEGTHSENQLSSGTSNLNSNGEEFSNSFQNSGSSSFNRERSRSAALQRAKERSVQEGAQAMLTRTLSKSQGSSVNWASSSSLLWKEETEETDVFTCEAMRRCRLLQVYATCGALTIRSKVLSKTVEELQYPISIPPPAVSNANNREWRNVNRRGEIWRVATDFSFFTPSGEWMSWEICPPDSVVTAHQLRRKFNFALTGLALTCTNVYDDDPKTRDRSWMTMPSRGRVEPSESWAEPYKNGSISHYANGINFVRLQRGGKKLLGNFQVTYAELPLLDIPRWATNSSHVNVTCPPDHAICGLSTMQDLEGRGFLTAVAFKCCSHCVQTEIVVTHYDVINAAPTEDVREVRTTTGLDKTKTFVDSTSTSSDSSVDSGGISRSGLQAGFAARFGNSSKHGVDWAHTDNSLWTNSTTVTERFTCAPWHRCTYKQVVGVCGSILIPTKKFFKFAESLHPEPEAPVVPGEPTSKGLMIDEWEFQRLDGEVTPVHVRPNGELWIQINEFQSTSPSMNKLEWGVAESCPPGAVVTGYEFRKSGSLWNGLKVHCSRWNRRGKLVQAGVFSSTVAGTADPAQEWQTHVETAIEKSPAIGFTFFLLEWSDINGELAMAKDQPALLFDKGQVEWPPEEENVQTNLAQFTCPKGYAICGIQTQLDTVTRVLTSLRFRCCFFCQPNVTSITLSTIRNQRSNSLVTRAVHYVVGAKMHADLRVEGKTSLNSTVLSNFNFVRHLFADRLPFHKENENPFDWERTSSDLWTEKKESSVDHQCDAGRNCFINQLVGTCGPLEIHTNVLENEEILHTQKFPAT